MITIAFAALFAFLLGGAGSAVAAPAFSISGSVVDYDDANVAGATIGVYDVEGDGTDPVATGTSTSAGKFTIPAIAPGNYVFQISAAGYIDQWYDGYETFEDADVFTVSTKNVTGIDVTLAPLTENDPFGSIDGTVVDQDEAPVMGVAVAVYSDEGDQLSTTVTDEDGAYSVGDLDAADYKVQFTVDGYPEQWYGGGTDFASGALVTVEPGETSYADYSFAMAGQPSFGSITGLVLTSDHTGVNGAVVELTNGTTGETADTVTTDADGRYTFANVITGPVYSLTVRAEGYVTAYQDVIEVESQQVTEVPDTIVSTGPADGYTVSGTVTGVLDGDLSPSGLGDVFVSVTPADEDAESGTAPSGYAYTDEDGNYSIPNLVSGQAIVMFEDSTGFKTEWYNNAATRSDAASIDVSTNPTTINAVLERGASITGTVLGADGEPARVPVVLHNADGAGDGYNVYPDEDGFYQFLGLPAGSYKVYAGDWDSEWLGRWYGGATRLGAADIVTVDDTEEASDIDIELPLASSISGSIIDADSAPVGKVSVTAYSLGGDFIASSWSDTGDYVVNGLTAGTYTLQFDASNTDADVAYADQWYAKAFTQSAATPVVVKAGAETPNKNVRLVNSGSITGHIVNAAGGSLNTQLASAQAALYTTTGDLVATATTDVAGDEELPRYLFDRVAPGSYLLKFSAGSSYVPEYWNNKKTRATATRVGVKAGATTTVGDGVLSVASSTSKSSITGTVTDTDGAPLAGIAVSALTGDDRVNGRTVQTDAAGKFTIATLAAGSYSLRYASAPATDVPEGTEPPAPAYAPQWWKGASSAATATYFTVKAGKTVAARNAVMVDAASLTGSVAATLGNNSGVVRVYDADGNEAARVDYAQNAYTFTGLAPGQYRVLVSPLGGENSPTPTPVWSGDKSTFATAVAIDVAAGSAVTVPLITAPDAVTSIAGSVVAAADKLPVSDVQVAAYRLTPDGSYEPFAWGYSNGLGVYTIDGLAVGSYKLLVASFDYPAAYKSQYYLGATTLAKATVVTVGEVGATTPASKVSLIAATPVVQMSTPTISGTVKVGKKLKASVAARVPSTATLSYQWLRDGKKISKATKSAYTLTTKDKGKEITVKVAAKKTGYTSVAKTSLPRNTLG